MRNWKNTILRGIFAALLLALAPTLSAIGPRERVYVRTDKEVYLAGELVWIKLIVTDSLGGPSALSQIGYVEIQDPATAHVQAKIELREGIGQACLELPATLPTGYYCLTAYTRQMRNESDSAFFRTTLGVVNTFRADPSIPTDTTLFASPEPETAEGFQLSLNKTQFERRENGELTLDGLPANTRTLSVAIAERSPVPVPGRRDLSGWLGELPKWADLPRSERFLPEYEGHILEGRLIDTQTGEAADAEGIQALLGFVGEGVNVFGGQQQADRATVRFFTKRVTGFREVATTTYDPAGLGNGPATPYRVDLSSPYATAPVPPLPAMALNTAWASWLERRHLGLQVQRSFENGRPREAEAALPHFQWLPFKSYPLNDYRRFPTMGETVFEFVESVSFKEENGRHRLHVLLSDLSNGVVQLAPPLVLLDGIPVTDHELIYQYDPALVERLDVYRERYNFGGQLFEGIFALTTFEHDYRQLSLTPPAQIFDYEGARPWVHFPAPTYDSDSTRLSRQPDYRQTLLWQPEVEVAPSGPTRIPFTTSDAPGDYEVRVEGLTKDGRPLVGRLYFRVE